MLAEVELALAVEVEEVPPHDPINICSLLSHFHIPCTNSFYKLYMSSSSEFSSKSGIDIVDGELGQLCSRT